MNSSKIVIPFSAFTKKFLENSYDENMFNHDGSINPNYNSFKKTGLLATIFEDHFDNVYNSNKEIINKYRPNAKTEINKIIDCHNKSLGFSVYECPNCHDMIFVGHTCKSRLCSSCGYKYKNERVENILQTVYRCKHRQIVFTIPKELRKFFFFPFSTMIDILFKAVSDTIYSILNESYKFSKKRKKLIKYMSKIKYNPGFFSFLHTFGRDLKWNPHIHVLLAEIKLGDNNTCLKWNYFNYDALSIRFQNILLKLLTKKLGKQFYPTKTKLFNKYKKGFYVYAEPKKFNSLKNGIEYVTRYCGRAPISENRIINYDGKNVSFCYNDHKDNSYHEVTLLAQDFILLIIRHIIPTQYKIIRYYGFYRKKHPIHDKMILLIDKAKRNIRKTFLKYEFSILKSFNKEPYNCPKCETKMDFVFVVT